MLVTAKRKYLIAKSRFKEGYIESFGVLGAIIGGFSVILVYLCSASFRAHLFLDVPSAVMVGAIMGCMNGSLIGCVFAMASSQLVADANFTAIPSAQGASEQTGSQQTAFKQIGSNQTGSEQIASEQEGSTKLSAGAHIIPLTTKTTKAPLKSPRNNGSALG